MCKTAVTLSGAAAALGLCCQTHLSLIVPPCVCLLASSCGGVRAAGGATPPNTEGKKSGTVRREADQGSASSRALCRVVEHKMMLLVRLDSADLLLFLLGKSRTGCVSTSTTFSPSLAFLLRPTRHVIFYATDFATRVISESLDRSKHVAEVTVAGACWRVRSRLLRRCLLLLLPSQGRRSCYGALVSVDCSSVHLLVCRGTVAHTDTYTPVRFR